MTSLATTSTTSTSTASATSAKPAIPDELSREAIDAIGAALKPLLADVFALYLKTKNYHWHMRGAQFRDYHLLLDEQADQLFAMTDPIAERARKLGAATLRSIGDIARHQRIADSDEPSLAPLEMLRRLAADNRLLTRLLRAAHEVADAQGDIATASLIENWVDETERRAWFLLEITSEA